MRSLPCLTFAAALVAAAANSPALPDVRCGPAATIRVGVAPPPPLPQTDQPPMPAYGYVWTPGFWLWNQDINDYYWTPGAWILPPAIGLFWTPGYWAWDDGVYLYHAGYWGPHVGFYGGVRYGFGYWGHGYDGGYWRGRTFYYNRAYNNIGHLHINALYEHRVPEDRLGGRTSFNGGPGGVVAAERADDRLADSDRHIAATADQARRSQSAAGDPTLRASVNHGHPLPAGAGSHVATGAAQAVHAQGGRAAARFDAGHGSPSHTVHAVQAAPIARPAYVVQPRHEAIYSHYAPARQAPAHMQSQTFHAQPQHWTPPGPVPFHAGPPRGGEIGHPRQEGRGRP